MSVRRGPYNIAEVQANRTAQALRELLQLANRGKLTGVAVGCIFSDGSINHMLAGRLDTDPVMAYYVTGGLHAAVARDAKN